MAQATNALVSVKEFKTLQSISGDSINVADPKIESLIDSASTWIETYTGRLFITATGLKEYFVGNGTPKLWLNNAPISGTPIVKHWEGTTSGWVDVVATYTYSLVVETTKGYIYFNDGNLFSRDTPIPRREFPVWEITYDYGWSQANVPKDLKLACVLLASHITFLNEKIGILQETFGDNSATFIRSAIPKEVLRLVSSYRRQVVA